MERLCRLSCQPFLPELFSLHTVNRCWIVILQSLPWDCNSSWPGSLFLNSTSVGCSSAPTTLFRPHRLLRPTYINQLVNFPIAGNWHKILHLHGCIWEYFSPMMYWNSMMVLKLQAGDGLLSKCIWKTQSVCWYHEASLRTNEHPP